MKKTFFTLGVVALLSFGANFAYAIPNAEFDLAKALVAADAGKQMLLVEFTGSDWCPPCKRLRSGILETEEFAEYLKERNLRFVELDFPRAKGKVSKEIMKEREAIMNRYNVGGFPTVLIIDSDGSPYGRIVGIEKTPAAYLKRVSEALALKEKFAAEVAAAMKLKGDDRAEALAGALTMLPMEFRSFQNAVIKELIAVDPADRFGFAAKDRTAKLLAEQREMLRSFFAKHRGQINGEGLENAKKDALDVLSKDLLPEIRQELLKFVSDCYIFSGDYPNALESLKAAIAVDPDSKTGKSLAQWIPNIEKAIEAQKAEK